MSLFSIPNFRSLASSLGIGRSAQRALTGSSLESGAQLTFNIEGFDRLRALVEQLPDQVAKREMLKAGRRAADLVKKRAAELAPFNPDVPLGRPSWRTMRLRQAIRRSVRAKSAGAAGFNLLIALGVDSKHGFFGRYVEKGFVHFSRSGRGKTVKAQPFIRPAAAELKRSAVNLFRDALREGALRVLRKLRKAA